MREYNMIQAWHSGQVTRKHSMMNLRAENIAEHTWGVVFILLMLWKKIPLHVILRAQFHDFGEKATGDLPATVKWANPDVAEKFDRMEREYEQKMLPAWVVEAMDQITPMESLMIEFADRVELCLSQSRERRLGNTYAMGAFGRSFEKARQAYETMVMDHKLQENHSDLWLEMAHFWQELTNEKDALGKL